MRILLNQKLLFLCVPACLGLLLTACGTMEKAGKIERKPPVKSEIKKEEKKATPLDLSKLTLEEINNLPSFKECRSLLSKADQELEKRPRVSVKINAFEGLSEIVNLEKMFYLEPRAEQYPLDDSIRHYMCPKKIEDVKVFYQLKKGSSYAPWYYFSYAGKEENINTRAVANPRGYISSRLDNKPPSLVLKIDKMRIVSLHPSHTVSNEDMDFLLRNIKLDTEKNISFVIYNKSQKNLTIRDVRLTVGPYHFHTELKGEIVKLAPHGRYIKRGIKSGFNSKLWVIKDATKPVRLISRIVYQVNGKYKLLSGDEYITLQSLGVNQEP